MGANYSLKSRYNKHNNNNKFLNDNILCLILNELNIRQLLRVESVSKQFRDCVRNILLIKTCLTIGQVVDTGADTWFVVNIQDTLKTDNLQVIYERNISREFCHKTVCVYNLVESHRIFRSVVQKCANITRIFLNNCLIGSDTMDTIADYCPQVRCLSMSDVYCISAANEWTQCVRNLRKKLRLNSLSIKGVHVLAHNCGYFYHSFEYSFVLFNEFCQ